MVPTRLSQVATRACCGCALRFHIITLFYHFKMFIAWKIIWFFTGTIPNKRSTRSRISSLKATWRSTVTTNLCDICQVVSMGFFGIQVARASPGSHLANWSWQICAGKSWSPKGPQNAGVEGAGFWGWTIFPLERFSPLKFGGPQKKSLRNAL